MEVCFDLPTGPEKQDWKSFYHVYYRLNPAAAAGVLILRILCSAQSILMAFAVVGVLTAPDSRPSDAAVPAVLCLVGAALALGWGPLTRRLSRRTLRAPNEHMVVTINEAGVRDESGPVTTQYAFSAFYALCYYRDTYLLFITKRTALVLPERTRLGGSSPALTQFLEEKTGKTLRRF